ncbi:unnamed protein product [Mesocestoides corti]|uniref:Integron gene cassette protein n=1 Tax=Mesocestoides corti TaxID=53468 RepID=A0A0R3U4P1_MESCO|nr:unnamed protein product [Mesocestoides corti]
MKQEPRGVASVIFGANERGTHRHQEPSGRQVHWPSCDVRNADPGDANRFSFQKGAERQFRIARRNSFWKASNHGWHCLKIHVD